MYQFNVNELLKSNNYVHLSLKLKKKSSWFGEDFYGIE
jgi:hypothetical protein